MAYPIPDETTKPDKTPVADIIAAAQKSIDETPDDAIGKARTLGQALPHILKLDITLATQISIENTLAEVLTDIVKNPQTIHFDQHKAIAIAEWYLENVSAFNPIELRGLIQRAHTRAVFNFMLA